MHEHNQVNQNRGGRAHPSNFTTPLDRGMRCGSLDGLARSVCFDCSGAFGGNGAQNYFNKKLPICFTCRDKCSYDANSSMHPHHHHSMQNRHSDSYMDLLEFITTPYYQYQRKNVLKRDFCGNTIITFSYIRQVGQTERVEINVQNCNSSSQTQQQQQIDGGETVEVCIPIKVNSPPSVSSMSSSSEDASSSFYTSQLHRNEKQIFINNPNNFGDSVINENMLLLARHQPAPGYQDPFETFRKNMKRFVQERLSRFEAEITLTNNNNNQVTNSNSAVPIHVDNGRNRSLSNQNGARIRLIEDHPSILSFREINNQLNSNSNVNLNASSHVNSKVRNHSSFEQQQQARVRSSSRPASNLMVVDPMSVTNLMYVKVVDGHLLN
jgi:hypothetical protein